MKKIKALSALLLIALFSTNVIASPKTQEALKVGAILPLTGEMSFVGTDILRGMQIGLSELPKKEIELIYEDDHSFSKAETVKAAKKLIEADKVDILLNGAVNTANALAPILERSKIPGIVIWDNNHSIRKMK